MGKRLKGTGYYYLSQPGSWNNSKLKQWTCVTLVVVLDWVLSPSCQSAVLPGKTCIICSCKIWANKDITLSIYSPVSSNVTAPLGCIATNLDVCGWSLESSIPKPNP